MSGEPERESIDGDEERRPDQPDRCVVSRERVEEAEPAPKDLIGERRRCIGDGWERPRNRKLATDETFVSVGPEVIGRSTPELLLRSNVGLTEAPGLFVRKSSVDEVFLVEVDPFRFLSQEQLQIAFARVEVLGLVPRHAVVVERREESDQEERADDEGASPRTESTRLLYDVGPPSE
jgi:hypothetical protein